MDSGSRRLKSMPEREHHSEQGISGILFAFLIVSTLLISVPFVVCATPTAPAANIIINQKYVDNPQSQTSPVLDLKEHRFLLKPLLLSRDSQSRNFPERSLVYAPADLVSSGAPHVPILITGNSDFQSQSWPGEGTADHPYIIAGLEINATTGVPAVNITNTDVYFVIRDCRLSSNSTSVVQLSSVLHVSVTNNTILNGVRGITALHSSDISVYSNEFYAFSWAGIYVEDCSQTMLMSNNCTLNFIGLHIEQSESVQVENNTFFGNIAAGIELYLGCELITVYNNAVLESVVGIHLQLDCSNNIVDSNNCTIADVGISSENCVHNSILNNFGRQAYSDIYLANCTSFTISGNDCGDGLSSDHGSISLYNSNNSVITYNHVQNSFISIEITEGSSNNEISFNNCSLFAGGVVVWYNAPSNVVSNNTCSDMYAGEVGVYILASEFCEVIGNECNESTYSIAIESSNHTDVIENFCYGSTDQSIGVWASHFTNIEGNVLTLGSTGLDVTDSTFVKILDNACSNFTSGPVTGIHLDHVYNSTIEGNELRYDSVAILLESCEDCSVLRNTCVQDDNGIVVVSGSDNVLVEGNYCHLIAGDGLVASGMGICTVTKNTCTNISGNCLVIYQAQVEVSWNNFSLSSTGINAEEVEGTITQNTIEKNMNQGLYAMNTIDLNVTWNIYESNSENAYAPGAGIFFDYNYWSNYTGIDANADGIGDTWHKIDGGMNNDTHPLMFYPTIPSWAIKPIDQEVEYGENFLYILDAITSPKAAPISEWWISDSHFAINMGTIENGTFLDIGEYHLEVRVYNLYGFYLNGTFTVGVADTISPLVFGPADFSFPSDSTGYSVRWHATDKGPASYSIMLDDTVVRSGAWNASNEEVFILCDGLTVGVHNYTVTFTDIGGNSASDTVIVEVTLSPSQVLGPIVGIALTGAAIVGVVFVIYTLRKRNASK
jgi:parallel beta-helix repeat protein